MGDFATRFDRRGYPYVDARTGYGEWVATYENTVRDVIPKLKAAGGSGIVEYPLSKVVL